MRFVRTQGRQPRAPETKARLALGHKVRELREDAAISQEDLAYAIGMSRRYLSGIERGEANPSFDQLVRLAEGLSIHLDQLMPERI